MPKTKLHKKPTPEELQENMDKAVEELDKPETPEPPKDVKKEDPKPDKPDEDVKVETDDIEPETDDTTVEEPDYKKKFAESTREAQILASKNRKLNEAIEKAGDVKPPTEKELTKEYPEWEDMSEFEQKIASENLVNRKKFDAITEATKGFKDMDKWVVKVDEFIEDPLTLTEHPGLEGKEDEFKLFVTKPTRRGVDMEDLVSAFMYSEDSKPKKGKGSMFEVGTGGDSKKVKPKGDKISIEESINMRNTDYKKYLQYVKDGKIDLSEI